MALIVNFGTACTKDPTSLSSRQRDLATVRWRCRDLGRLKNSSATTRLSTTDGCTGRRHADRAPGQLRYDEHLQAVPDPGRKPNDRRNRRAQPGKKWEAYFWTNTEWPGKQQPAEEGTCSTITTAAKSGNPELIAKLKETQGGIGYADLPQAVQPALCSRPCKRGWNGLPGPGRRQSGQLQLRLGAAPDRRCQ